MGIGVNLSAEYVAKPRADSRNTVPPQGCEVVAHRMKARHFSSAEHCWLYEVHSKAWIVCPLQIREKICAIRFFPRPWERSASGKSLCSWWCTQQDSATGELVERHHLSQ